MTSMSDAPLRNVADTARWAAVYRADESDRPDALFRDPHARALGGERGRAIADQLSMGRKTAWSWVTRTWLFDRFIEQSIRDGTDLVVNLAAGLDARPYRMNLPPGLTWVEVDHPEILAAKAEVLDAHKPVCRVERHALDLADVSGRRALLDDLARRGTRGLVITEGLLLYLKPDAVGELGRDLAARAVFQRWALDLLSPGLLAILKKNMSATLDTANASFHFAPEEGPRFFEPLGWRPLEVRGIMKTAAKLKRAPLLLRILGLLPEPKGRLGRRPWGGVCLMGRA